MTKKLFANGVAKAIPVVGAVLSGGLSLGTFLPMSKRLQKHLASLELTKPGHRQEEDVVVDVDVIKDDAPDLEDPLSNDAVATDDEAVTP